MSGDPKKVSAPAAKKALEIVDGDKNSAYSAYIKLFFNQTGKVDINCDNEDLQAFYENMSKGER